MTRPCWFCRQSFVPRNNRLDTCPGCASASVGIDLHGVRIRVVKVGDKYVGRRGDTRGVADNVDEAARRAFPPAIVAPKGRPHYVSPDDDSDYVRECRLPHRSIDHRRSYYDIRMDFKGYAQDPAPEGDEAA